MENKVLNSDFFKSKNVTVSQNTDTGQSDAKTENLAEKKIEEKFVDKKTEESSKKNLGNKPIEEKINVRRCVRIDPQIIYTIDKACKIFDENRQTNVTAALEQVARQAKSDKFSVAVVGEFSKGKSTFINTLLDKEFLPVSDLPATAILTRIRYSQKEMLVFFDEKGAKNKVMPLSKASWEGYTADNFGDEIIKGAAIVGINDSWLGAYNIELIDTPGAGDLDENRAQLIGDALLGCDAAIITISATAALSQSEKLFIEERLISKKTPFLMLIVTKLDQVPMRERGRLIEYIKGNLKLMGIDIPVYIPYDIEMSDDKFGDIIGTDKIRQQIVEWISADKRVELTQQWMAAKAISIIDNSITALNTKKMLYQVDEDKRAQLIKQKKEKLSQSSLAWNELRIQMLKKENACYEQLLSKADEYSISIKERLQYEVAHANNPQKWWEEDYPYRLKIELSNMSVSIENVVSRIVSGDIKWFNAMLDKYFKTHISYEAGQITDKDEYKNSAFANEIEFEDIDKKRNITRIGTTVLSLAGAMVAAAAGVYPLVLTMGIGTGSTIITEKVFKGKIDQQRTAIKEAIEKNIPEIIMAATSESENRLKQVYEDIINEAKKSEEAWFKAQESAIEDSEIPKNKDEFDKLKNMLGKIENIKSDLAVFLKN